MKFSRNNKPLFQIPEEGFYAAKILSWREGKARNTMFGLTPTANVFFELNNGMKVAQSMLIFPGPTSLIEKLVNVTLGEADEEVDLNDLIGQECGVEIRHNHVGGTTYANVVDVFPISELELEEEVAEEPTEMDDMDNSDDLGDL
ncbi:hypothetical protein ACFSO0_11565 [Brevibacillus sp. GCM10020057]|uniref:hypothetical protein n=1 Tax=Brevibacillus sp. GCM10020057 TaxID=3317327 RepID=UPI003645EF6F